jgi:hypothetical protein
LLDRYPVVVADEAASEPEVETLEKSSQMQPTKIIELAEWIVAVAVGNCEVELANEIDQELEGEAPALATGIEQVTFHESEDPATFTLPQQRNPMPWLGQVTTAAQLAFEFL